MKLAATEKWRKLKIKGTIRFDDKLLELSEKKFLKSESKKYHSSLES